MKICLISFCTPTPFNSGAPSALPYHLAKYRNTNIELEIYSFNSNHISEESIKNIEKELDAKIEILPTPYWYKLMFKFHLAVIRVLLRYPFLSYLSLPKSVLSKINNGDYDGVWIYGEEMSHFAKHFPDVKTVVLGPDCQALYFVRASNECFVKNSLSGRIKNALMLQKSTAMAKAFPSKNVQYELVGEEDRDYLLKINPSLKVDFLHHPHYDCYDKKVIKFSQPKIKLLVAGRYDFYMKEKCDEIFGAMLGSASELKDCYEITFLGKDWEIWAERLQSVGYETCHIKFAPDYQKELIKHDIQLTPIGVGTGTKGKVLDAFANGLMVMGTLRALENIQVVHGESCILYDKPEDAIAILNDIPQNINKYEQITEAGRKAVLTNHGRLEVADQLFALFKK